MTLQSLLRKFGAWTTVLKWQEPRLYRVRLRGDWLPRLALALAAGSLATTVLLVLFAVNRNPPHPAFALFGMLIVGGLAWMFLAHGRRTAGGQIRLCEEGLIRRRMYVGLSAQWVEEWSWPYSQLPQCAILPGTALNQSFAVLLLTDGSQLEVVGVPARVDLRQLADFLARHGVVVRHDVGLPPQYAQPLGQPLPLIGAFLSFVVLLGGMGFYALNVWGEGGPALAREDGRGVPVLPPALAPTVDALVEDAAPAIPSAQPSSPPDPLPGLAGDPGSPVPAAPLIPDRSGSYFGPVSLPADVQLTPTTPAPRVPSAPTLPVDQPKSPAPAEPAPSPGDREPRAEGAKSRLVGGAGGVPFELFPPEHRPILGFRFRLGSWAGKSSVALLDPVDQPDQAGPVGQSVMAKEGYAVGGLQVDADDLVRAVRVVFVKRLADGALDKADYYFSDWIGEPTGQPVVTLGKGHVPVIGLFGRRGLVLDALGLVLAE